MKRRETVILMVSLWIGGLALPIPLSAAGIQVEPFDTTAKGEMVSRIILSNDHNMRVTLINYGATLSAIEVPDRSGQIENIVLSLPDMASYTRSQRRWGGIIGRYAGRIGGAQLTLDGRAHRLEAGRNGVTLHGGSNGYDKRLWAFRTERNSRSVAAVFTLISPDGDQGFPGNLRLEVTYRLMRKAQELRIEYRATTSAPTVINLTNHAFFNLAGAGQSTIAGHELTIFADQFAPTNDIKIPTGQLSPVAGTILDFRRPRTIGPLLAVPDPLTTPSRGFDHSYVFRAGKPMSRRPIATLYDPTSGRRMEIATTEPGLQLNTGNGFDGSEFGSEGVAYPIHGGIALETQHLPDSPNQPHFPSTRLNPNRPFYSVTTYRFSVD
jgi:aldose 1-epimerase